MVMYVILENKLPKDGDIISTIPYRSKDGSIKYKKAILFHTTNGIFEDLEKNNYDYPTAIKDKTRFYGIVHASCSGVDENVCIKMEPYSPLILIF